MAGEVVARLSAISVHTPHQCEERSVVALFLEVVVGFAPRPDIRYMVGAGLRGHDDVPAWWYGGRWVPRYPSGFLPVQHSARSMQATRACGRLLDRSAGSKTDPIEMTVIDRALCLLCGRSGTVGSTGLVGDSL
jgi:hypothetical protein